MKHTERSNSPVLRCRMSGLLPLEWVRFFLENTPASLRYGGVIYSNRMERCVSLHPGDVIIGHIAGLAGGQVHDLAPGLAHGDHLQLVSGGQPAQGGRGLVGLRPQAHASVGLGVQGLGGHGVGGDGAEVVAALGDFILPGLVRLQELGHHVAGSLAVGLDVDPALGGFTAGQHFQLRAAFDLVEHLGVLIGSLADIQPSAVGAVDEERLSGIGGGRGGENGNHKAQGHQNNNGDAENLFHGRLPSFLHPSPVCGGVFIHWSGVIVLTHVDTEKMDGWQSIKKNSESEKMLIQSSSFILCINYSITNQNSKWSMDGCASTDSGIA